ncbi:Glutaryl-CoA dehydrogenase, mitochondrial [Neolecta irregularis DAH-3]|uniref:Glutaryl-CoA dehydrogenase, mitochondrial n=1 Tax=Neolecta irregularis (strain DAH-3) TaxID=1198029 RepID=A0A1U7LWK1_NEOID|nr:Glutaryl-CoA dehydrogenase, mitochondrial [Neolecta irregularis DAH-3]|eukprot:OLL27047.1 Glutaryl-CoA dehydrogenase, mitochondrial [Neolecta irregularis DAH-3]
MISRFYHCLRQASNKFTRLASTFAKFDYIDPLSITSLLTPEELAISETANQYVEESLRPRARQDYRNESFNLRILKEMGELGFLGCTIPEYGGISSVGYGLITREIERIDSGYRSAMSVQSSLVMHPIYAFGSDKLKKKYLPGLGNLPLDRTAINRKARADLIGCFGLTEPNHGSDPASMSTTATKTENGYILNGSKTWITNSPLADLCVIWANCKCDSKIRGFIVERDAKGLSTPIIKHKTGLRASITGQILLDNVFVPSLNILSVEGLKGPFSCLNNARYGISWGVLGALEECLEITRRYSLERVQFGKSLASFQLVQKKLADVVSDIAYGQLACLHVGRLKDSPGSLATEMISLIKRKNCDAALKGSRKCMEVFGGNAVSDEYDIGRIAANLFVVQTYEGQSDIHGLILGRGITGIQVCLL